MANEEKNYTLEFKTEVARQALDRGKKNLDKLSRKYEVPVSTILRWAAELEKGTLGELSSVESFEADDSDGAIDIEIADREIAESVGYGVMPDKHNYRRLIFWSVFGIILVVIFIESLRAMYDFNVQLTQERVSTTSEFYEINRLRQQENETLNSFGVVNLEEGIYRIPIDSAIDRMIENEQ